MNIPIELLAQVAFVATATSISQIVYAGNYRKPYAKAALSVALGLAILLCMSYPAYISDNFRTDIRIVPLLLGTLYGGRWAGLCLLLLVVIYRAYIGIDIGFYTSLLTIAFSMPFILYAQKWFQEANKRRRLWIATGLAMFYCFVGIGVVAALRGYTPQMIQVQGIQLAIIAAAVLVITALNEMIHDMISKNVQLQVEAKDAEIAVLRSQINPHFLYNTLNSIAALCRKAPERAEELTLEFAQYLQRSFAFNRLDKLIALDYELEIVKAYLHIEQARFGSRLNVEWDVTDNAEAQLPPLILQPLVENAVKHGLMSTLAGGTVRVIACKQAGNEYYLAVEDDGCGMSAARLEEVRNPIAGQKGIGLRNIGQRLELLFGTSLHIESAEGAGTKVSFTIPARKINGGEGQSHVASNRGGR